MTNQELLLAAGWFVEDQWWCSPVLNNEKTFHVSEKVNNLPLETLIRRISVVARDYGYHEGRKDGKAFLIQELEGLISRSR